MLAVAVDTVAQVGGGAGVLRGAVSGRREAGSDRRVLGVEGGRASALGPVLPLALAFPSLPSIFTDVKLCNGKNVKHCT